jgi:hypothetical protein
LNGKYAAIKCHCDPTSAGHRRLAGKPQRIPWNEPRVEAKQQITRGPEGSRSVETMIAHELPKSQEGIDGVGIAHPFMLE